MAEECYRCNSTESLSVKYTTRTGTKRYLCRECRNKDYRKYVDENDGIPKPYIPNPKLAEWNEISKQTLARIEEKYANH